MAWSGNGRFSFFPRFSIGTGLVIVTVALMFLLNLNWEVWWPLMIILPGVATWLVGGAKGSVGLTAVIRLGRWLGFMMVLLGLTFLADQTNLINLQALFGNFHWWSFFIFIPGVGAFVEGWRVMRQATWAATGCSLRASGLSALA